MSLFLRSLAALALSCFVSAQVVRPEQAVDQSTSVWIGSSIATAGDLTALAYTDLETGDILVVTSDAYGLDWSSPTKINTLPVSWALYSPIAQHSVHVIGDVILVAWNAQGNVYFNRFDGTAWAGEQVVDYGLVSGVLGLGDWHTAVSQGANGTNVTFALGLRVFDGSVFRDEVVLVSSQDGGVTFGAPVQAITAAGGRSVIDIDLVLDDDEGYVGWIDDRAGTFSDLYVQKTINGGLTWDGFPSEKRVNSVLLNENEVNDGFDLHARGGALAVTWKEERPGTGSGANSVDREYAMVSADGGQTIGANVFLGFAADFGVPAIEILPSGKVVVLWSGRLADSGAQVAVHDAGVWGANHQVALTAGNFPQLVSDSQGMIIASLPTRDGPHHIHSLDEGATFSTELDLSVEDTEDYSDIAYNEMSESLIACWSNFVTVPIPDFPFTENISTDAMTGGLFLCDAAQVVDRTGGNNLASYVATPAVLGEQWTGTVTTPPGYGHALLFAYAGAANVPYGASVILVDLASPKIFALVGSGSPTIPFTTSVPLEPTLCGRVVPTQGVHLGTGVPFLLTNAQDLILGAFR